MVRTELVVDLEFDDALEVDSEFDEVDPELVEVDRLVIGDVVVNLELVVENGELVV